MTVWVQAGMSSGSCGGRKCGFMGDLPSELWSSQSLTQGDEEVNTMASSWRWGVVKDWLPASETMRCRSDSLPGSMRRPNRALEQSDLPPDLSPEQRRKLEALIRWADETAESLPPPRSEEHTSELQSRQYLVC